MLFHHSSSDRDADGHVPGRKSMMCYAGGAHARPLLELSDPEVRDRFLADVERVLPEVRGALDLVDVRKWPAGNSFPSPGCDLAAVEKWNAREGARVHLAGDYFAPLGGTADAAAASGVAAADAVLADLDRLPTVPTLDAGARRHG
jgi:oxygen-dependent protoporphyrinogen oxidase